MRGAMRHHAAGRNPLSGFPSGRRCAAEMRDSTTGARGSALRTPAHHCAGAPVRHTTCLQARYRSITPPRATRSLSGGRSAGRVRPARELAAHWHRPERGRLHAGHAVPLASRPVPGHFEVAKLTPQLARERAERAALGDRIPPPAPADPPPEAAPARGDLPHLAGPERAQAAHAPHRRKRVIAPKAFNRLIGCTHGES